MFTIFLPMFERGDLKSRMKAVAVEREEIRARERARQKAESLHQDVLDRFSKTKMVRGYLDLFEASSS